MKWAKCRECDSDGEVLCERGHFIKCPRCAGTRRIEVEEQPVNEEQMNRLLMIASMTLTVMAGLATVGLLVEAALTFSWATVFVGLLLGACTVAFGWATNYYGQKVTSYPVVHNADERAVLNAAQRRELKKARGAVVMEKALIDIDHERQNIVHHQMLEAGDPEKPPFKTPWTEHSEVRELRPREDGR